MSDFNAEYLNKQIEKSRDQMVQAQNILAALAGKSASERETMLQTAANNIQMAHVACLNAANMQARMIVEGRVL